MNVTTRINIGNRHLSACILLVFGIFLSGLNNSAYGQGEADIWYIGSNIKFDFSAGGDPVISDGITVTLGSPYESTSSISDANGDLIFAAVGDNVYDGNGNSYPLPASTWDVVQGTLVFPKPGTTNEYYLSVLGYNQSSGNAPMSRYYTVTDNGDGTINMSAPSNLLNQLTQAQAGIPKIDASGTVLDEYWLLTHETCTDGFRLFSVENSGVTLDRTVNTGHNLVCDGSFPPQYDVVGTLKFNSCYTRFAMAMGGKVSLYDFDAENGDITYVNEVSVTAPFGLEFSPNGDYLYTLIGHDNTVPGQIFRIPVAAGAGGLGAPVSLGATGGTRGGHLQLAPDGNIYFTAQRNFDVGLGGIGRITNPDGGGAIEQDFYVARGNPAWPATDLPQAVMMDLPNFLRSFVSSIASLKINGSDASEVQVCAGESVDFSVEIGGVGTPGVIWNASGSNTATANGVSDFTVTMSNAGTTFIDVTVSDDCGRNRVLSFEVEVAAVENATATLSTCPGRIATGLGVTGNNYKWYDSQGGTLLGLGATFDASAYEGGSIWVEPAGAIVSNPTADSRRSPSANGNLTGGVTTIVIQDGIANFNSFEARSYSWQSPSGNLVYELRDATNAVVGTPVTETWVNGWVQFTPTDWLVEAGTYTLHLTNLPAQALMASLSPATYTDTYVDISSANASVSNFDIDVDVEQGAGGACGNGSVVNVTSCCNQPTPGLSLTTGTSPFCVSDNMVLTATPNGATGTVVYKWYKDNTEIVGETGSTLTVNGVATSDAGSYTVAIASSTGCAAEGSQSSAVVIVVNTTPDISTTTPTSVCSPTTVDITSEWTDNNSTGGTVTYHSATPANGGNTIANQAAIAASGTYYVLVDNAGCTDEGAIAVTVESAPDLTITTATEDACADATVDITDNFTETTGATITYYDGPSSTGTVITNQAAISTSGTYYIHTQNGNCETEGSVDVTINPLPVASISGTTAICNDASDQATVTITFSAGTADFNWVVDGDGGDNQTGTSSGSSDSFTTMLDENYTLTSVTDDNGCVATSLTGNADITFSAEPTASHVTACPNGNSAPFEYTITVTVLGGDGASVVTGVTQVGATAVNFTDQGGGVFLSDPINESEIVDWTATDGANCAPVVTTDVQRTCSCPEVATIAIAAGSADSLCINGTPTTTDLEVSFVGGAGGQLYSFDIVETVSGTVQNVVAHDGDNNYLFAGQLAGTYEVQNVVGSCSGSGAGSIVIANYPEPAANISGGGPICSDGSNDTTAQIVLTSGNEPFNVSYNAPSGPQNLVAQSTPITIPVDEDGNYSLLNLTDANGCTADVADLSGTATGTSITPAVATITDPASTPFLTDGVSYGVVATDAGLGYTMTWSIDPTSTQASATLGSTSGATSTVNDMDDINNNPSGSNAATTTIILTVQDDNGICPLDDDTVSIVRVQESTPDAGEDTTLCSTAVFTRTGSTPIPGIETVEWIDVNGAMGPAGAVVSTTEDLNVNVASAGTYTFRYEITNSITARTNDDEFVLQIDEQPGNVLMTETSPKETCLSTENLPAATPTPATAVGTWTIDSQPGVSAAVTSVNDPTSPITGLETGMTQLTWSVVNGVCPAVTASFAYDKLQDLTSPRIILDGGVYSNQDVSDGTVDLCSGINYTMTGAFPANAGEAGEWNTNGGSNVTISAPTSTNVQPLTLNSAGTQTTWTWDIENTTLPQCGNPEFDITFNVFEAPDASFTVTSTDTCEGIDIVATAAVANAGDVLAWSVTSGSGNAVSPSASTTTVTGLGVGNNTLQLEISNDGCTSDITNQVISVEQTTTPTALINYTGSTTLCAPASLSFTSTITEGGTSPVYDWRENTASVGSSSTYSPSGLTANTYTYELIVTSDKRCVTSATASDQIAITVLDGPIPDVLENDTASCANSPVVLNAGSAVGSIQWFNGSGAIPGENGNSVTVTTAGTYYYTDDIGTCPPVLSDEVVVTFETVPFADAAESFDVCFSGESILLNGVVNTPTWHWEDESGTVFGQNQNPASTTPTIGGLYVYTIVAEGTLCPDAEDEVEVQVRAEVNAYNVFTPNGDGMNDAWVIDGIETYPDAIVRVYNQWGNLVYETFAGYSDNPWTGTSLSGGALPVATYYYIIDLGDGGACGSGDAAYVELMK